MSSSPADPAPSDAPADPAPVGETRPLALPLYLISAATSLFGNAAINIVLPWLVLERTGDPAMAGLVAAVSAIPSAFAAIGGGWLIDRFGRRLICVLADVGSAASVAALAIVDHVVGLNIGWFIVLGIAGALFDLPGMTARETLVANVAHTSGRTIDTIAGWKQGIFGIAWLAGPALAGLLLATMPAIDVVWVTAACSALAALTTAIMPLLPMREEPAEENPLGALDTVRQSPQLMALLIIAVASSLVVAPLLSVLLPAHFQRLHHADWLGLSMSAFAVGMVLGGGLYAGVLKRWRYAAWVLGMVLFTASFVFISTLQGFWLVAIGMAVAGVAQGVQGPINTVLMTEHVPERLRGRIFGLLTAINMISAPVGLGAMALFLTRFPLDAAGWALTVGWIPVAVFACVVPSLRSWLRAPVEGVAEGNSAGHSEGITAV